MTLYSIDYCEHNESNVIIRIMSCHLAEHKISVTSVWIIKWTHIRHNNKNKETRSHFMLSPVQVPSYYDIWIHLKEMAWTRNTYVHLYIMHVRVCTCTDMYCRKYKSSQLQPSMIHTQDHVEFRMMSFEWEYFKSRVAPCTRVVLQRENNGNHWFTQASLELLFTISVRSLQANLVANAPVSLLIRTINVNGFSCSSKEDDNTVQAYSCMKLSWGCKTLTHFSLGVI
jgi:hypothetical protein